MSKSQQSSNAAAARSPLFKVGIALAVLLCLVSCTFFLLIPTQSINVDTVYEGF